MFLSLFFYTVAFICYIFLYEYYKNYNKKRSIQFDFLQNLDTILLNLVPITRKKPFEQIKTQLNSYFHYDSIRIVFGIDFSASNEWHGRTTFNGQSLHKTNKTKIYNPYQKAICQLGNMFEDIFSSKIKYSCFVFGDEQSKDYSYMPLIGSGDEIHKYQNVLDAYLEKTENLILSGPTSLIPILKQLMVYGIHYQQDFTILIILTDELKFSHQDSTFVDSIRTLTNLSNVCLIIVGVGDGPWHRMSLEEHRLRESSLKKFNIKQWKNSSVKIKSSRICYDNFHFVDFNCFNTKFDEINYDIDFARDILKKLPTQLKQTSVVVF